MAQIVFILLLSLALVIGGQKNSELSLWTCGNHQGYCRRYCFTHENFVGAFGCPRKFSVSLHMTTGCGGSSCPLHQVNRGAVCLGPDPSVRESISPPSYIVRVKAQGYQ